MENDSYCPLKALLAGVKLHDDGLSVVMNPNPSTIQLAHGPAGSIMRVTLAGVSIACALPGEARAHLIRLLQEGERRADFDGRRADDPKPLPESSNRRVKPERRAPIGTTGPELT